MTVGPGLRALGPALAAAAMTEAAAGLVVAGLAAQARWSFIGDGTLITAVLAVALVDAVLVPGWVWRRERPGIKPLSARLVIAVGALPVAVATGIATGFILSKTLDLIRPELLGVPGLALGFVLFGVMFTTAGAVVGLGAALAQVADAETWSGRSPAGRVRSHVIGGVLGVGVFLAVTAMANAAGRPGWSPLALPLMLLLGGLPHNAMVLRDTARLGRAMPDKAPMIRRAASGAVVLGLIGAVLIVTAL